ncbi:hypothetical protein FXO37_25536 [Capsicum annuum]|nr:hypothetical protein FXO37_25536 [Capsicum annuum]
MHQKLQVTQGKRIKKVQILADGAATIGGELALGKNVLVAYMPCEGYNSEDVVLISERLVYEDICTSFHIRKYEIQTHVTCQGPEKDTNEIPHLEAHLLHNLAKNGIVMLGSWVETGVLVDTGREQAKRVILNGKKDTTTSPLCWITNANIVASERHRLEIQVLVYLSQITISDVAVIAQTYTDNTGGSKTFDGERTAAMESAALDTFLLPDLCGVVIGGAINLNSFFDMRIIEFFIAQERESISLRPDFQKWDSEKSSVRRDNKEMLSISQIQISPSMLLRSTYQGIERKDSGTEQVGLGSNGPLRSLYWSYSSCAPCERILICEGNRLDVPLTQPRNGLEGTAIWGIYASCCRAYFLLYIIRLAALSNQGPGHKGHGSRNFREIVMAQKQIWSGLLLFPVLVMFFISRLAETNRASFDLPEVEAESVAGYNVEYARDSILNSSLLAEANISGSRGLILTETRGRSLLTSKYSILGKSSRSDEDAGGGVIFSTKPSLPAAEEDPRDWSEIDRALDQLELVKIKEPKYLLDKNISPSIELEKNRVSKGCKTGNLSQELDLQPPQAKLQRPKPTIAELWSSLLLHEFWLQRMAYVYPYGATIIHKACFTLDPMLSLSEPSTGELGKRPCKAAIIFAKSLSAFPLLSGRAYDHCDSRIAGLRLGSMISLQGLNTHAHLDKKTRLRSLGQLIASLGFSASFSYIDPLC